jgi:hypothetical protein
MRHILLAVAAVVAVSGPATAETVQVTVKLHIPLSCGARLIEAVPVGDRVEVAVRRTCNTPHALTLSGPGMGKASVRELNSRTVRPAEQAVFRHTALTSDTTDHFVIEGAADVARTAADLQVAIGAL